MGKIDAYVAHYNAHKRPFVWTATADSIFDKRVHWSSIPGAKIPSALIRNQRSEAVGTAPSPATAWSLRTKNRRGVLVAVPEKGCHFGFA